MEAENELINKSESDHNKAEYRIVVGRIGKHISTTSPIRTETFVRDYSLQGHDDKGEDRQLPVYAEFQVAGRGEASVMKAALVGQTDHEEEADRRMFVVVYEDSEDGKRNVKEVPIEVCENLEEYIYNKQDKGDYLCPGFCISRKGDSFLIWPTQPSIPVEALVSEQARSARVKNITRRIVKTPGRVQDKAEQLWGKTKKARTTALIVGALSLHGGPVDMALDPFNDAKATVVQMWQDEEGRLGYGKDALLPEEWRTVARTMGDLDSHNDKAITERARQFKEAHSDQFVSQELVLTGLRSLENAADTNEAVVAVSKFLDFYGKSAGVLVPEEAAAGGLEAYKPEDLGKLKTAGKAIISTLRVFPKDLLALMDFRSFTFCSNMDASAHYDSGEEVVATSTGAKRVRTSDPEIRINISMMFTMGEATGLAPMRDTLLHEMGHSYGELAEEVLWGSPTLTDQLSPTYIPDMLFKAPRYQSFYGRMAGEENRAEKGRLILEGEVSHPDQVRKFTSKANKDRISELVNLEREIPGITDVLVAQRFLPSVNSGE